MLPQALVIIIGQLCNMNPIDCWGTLANLQRGLKKEFLLVEKEQQEKVKLKRQIEELVRSYHQHFVDLHYQGGQLLKEEGFDNCYNFIKDVIVTLSTDCQLGKLILLLSQENSSLPSLVIHSLYQNVETSDPFAKQITKLMHSLMLLFNDISLPDFEKEKLVNAWKLYMEKVERETYFQQIAETTIKKLLQKEQVRGGLSKDKKTLSNENKNLFIPLQSTNTEELISQLISKIENDAELCPLSVKIPLKALVESEENLNKVWKFISHFYISPFLKIANNEQLPSETKQRIFLFVDQLAQTWNFIKQLAYHTIQSKENSIKEENLKKIAGISAKLLEINEERMNCFISGKKIEENNSTIQIRIFGSCLSIIQLYDLLIMIHRYRDAFSAINPRVVTRTLKIFQISPKLQVLCREKAGSLYVSLVELRYEESISSDYYANYTVVYRGQTLKQMLKQVLVEVQNLSDCRAGKKKTLAEIFKGLASQHERNGVGIPAQLLMKIKYLVYLLNQKPSDHECQLMEQMLKDLKNRDTINIKLFEDTKFSLLKVYCNLRNVKNQLKNQRDIQKKVLKRIMLIRKLEALKLDLCLTSRASRNQSQIEEDRTDKYRYRMSLADDILIQPLSECIHKENIFTGRSSHPHSIEKFVQTFASLEEVRYYSKHPTFTHTQKTKNPYSYCDESKIGGALLSFIQILTDLLTITQEERIVLESVIFRSLHQILLQRISVQESPRKALIGQRDNLRGLEDRQSPRKRASLTRKRKGSFSQEELPNESIELESHQQQLHQMGKRYLQAMGNAYTPTDKMKKLRDIIEIYKIALGKGGKGETDRKVVQDLIDKLLIKTVLAAKVPNLISQLGFMETFLPEGKLMSGDGKVLKQFEKAVVKVFQDKERFKKEEIMNERF